MASQGPLVRVDTGRRHFIKMTPKDAAAWAAAHPVAVVAPEPVPESEIPGEDEPEPKKPAAASRARKPAARKN